MSERRARWLYRAQNSIWLWLGAAATASLFTFYLRPQEIRKSALGRYLNGPWDDLWTILFFIGGVLLVIGVWRVLPKLEAVGHLFFGTAVLINSVAVAFTTSTSSTFFTLLGAGIASFARLIWILESTPQE